MEPPKEREQSQALRHLLVTIADPGEGDVARTAFDELIFGSACEVVAKVEGHGLSSVDEVVRYVHEQTTLAFDSGEVQAALKRLAGQGRVRFSDQSQKSFTVRRKALRDRQKLGAEQEELESQVREQWLIDMVSRHPELTADEAMLAWLAMRESITRLIHLRSAEAANFLHLGDPAARIHFEAALNESRGIQGLSSSANVVDDVTKEEAKRFVMNSSGKRTTYLVSILNAAFLFHLLSLDPGASNLVRSVIKGKILYVDTNFLFALLALKGPRIAHAPGMIVTLSQKLSSELRVTRATLEEFKAAVKRRAGQVKRHILQREDFRRIIAERPEAEVDVDFMGQFYRALNSGTVKDIDDFERQCLQIEHAVEGWGIEVDENLTGDAPLSDSVEKRSGQLFKWHERARESCDHDALLEDYVIGLRSTRIGGLNDIDVWFLTYDRSLTRFAFKKPLSGQVPFTLLADDWLQIIRQFSPRTSDYDAAFLSMLTAPLLIDEDAVSLTQKVSALKRLERYTGMNASVAAAMIAEEEFVRRLIKADTPEEEEKLVNLELSRQTAALAKKVDRQEKQIESLEDQHTELLLGHETDKGEALAAHNEERALGIEDRAKLSDERDEATSASANLKVEVGRLTNELTEDRRALFGALVGLVVIAVWQWWSLPLWVGLVAWRGAIILTAVTIFFLAFGWLWQRKNVKQAGVGLLILNFFYALVSVLTS